MLCEFIMKKHIPIVFFSDFSLFITLIISIIII